MTAVNFQFSLINLPGFGLCVPGCWDCLYVVVLSEVALHHRNIYLWSQSCLRPWKNLVGFPGCMFLLNKPCWTQIGCIFRCMYHDISAALAYYAHTLTVSASARGPHRNNNECKSDNKNFGHWLQWILELNNLIYCIKVLIVIHLLY